ncbi:hypothetical protein [Mycolicibacterium cosmeticum]|uniref:hypothetical protein n=1 Tax=Mycolicibacterium cosmeticum TaxID=258533 RepID=UPI00320497DF
MSDLLLRAPGATSLATRVSARAAAAAHRVSLTIDPSVDTATAAAIVALWPPDDEVADSVTVSAHDIAASSVVAAYEARAVADLVLSSFARETNLLVPATRFLVVGTGPVADALAAALTRFGSRLEVAAAEPVGLWEIATRYAVGSRRITQRPYIAADVDVVVTTGVGHPPLTTAAVEPGTRPLIVVGASFSLGAETGSVRGLTQYHAPRPVFTVLPVPAEALAHTAAGIRAAYAVLLATVGARHADTALAEALQS